MHVTRLFCPPLKWEKGVGGMRGNGARECRTSLISPKHPTLESAPPGCAGVPPARSATKVRTAWVRGRPARTQQHKGTHRLGARASRPHAAPQRYAPPGCAGVPPACSAVTYSRFGHQNTQTPPSPLVGEGGWGDEGQRRTGLRKITHHSQDLPLRDSPALSTRTTKCHSVTNRRTGAQQDVSPIDGGQMCCYTTHQKKRGTALDRCSPQRRNP